MGKTTTLDCCAYEFAVVRVRLFVCARVCVSMYPCAWLGVGEEAESIKTTSTKPAMTKFKQTESNIYRVCSISSSSGSISSSSSNRGSSSSISRSSSCCSSSSKTLASQHQPISSNTACRHWAMETQCPSHTYGASSPGIVSSQLGNHVVCIVVAAPRE